MSGPSVLSSLSDKRNRSILREPTFRWTSLSHPEQQYFSSAKYAKEGLIRKPIFDNFRPPPLTLEDVGLLPQGVSGAGGLLQWCSPHKAAEQEQGLDYLPLITHTPTTNIPLRPASMLHNRSGARCFVLHGSHPARPTLEYLSLLPFTHLLEAALALSRRTRRPRAPTEARGAGGGSSL
ncbi:Histone-lysine N-methyltransferase 2A [Dissostichus eleginoides]|uniref:Histone-lysine N-methyltransferase 2A n=1 Tax=Dissostichus eleginoides TaxID=100907 RepID=A0AAD9CFX0_DISEL|nr:Histone-lysine N-methyltransferase 2A [Dissostichus eleginoides]